jgi:glycine dehydrogenase subunit 1
MDADALCAALAEKGILAGLPVDGGILWCCTELNSREEIDQLVEAIGEVCAK